MRAVLSIELREDAAHVRLHGLFREVKSRGDLFLRRRSARHYGPTQGSSQRGSVEVPARV